MQFIIHLRPLTFARARVARLEIHLIQHHTARLHSSNCSPRVLCTLRTAAAAAPWLSVSLIKEGFITPNSPVTGAMSAVCNAPGLVFQHTTPATRTTTGIMVFCVYHFTTIGLICMRQLARVRISIGIIIDYSVAVRLESQFGCRCSSAKRLLH